MKIKYQYTVLLILLTSFFARAQGPVANFKSDISIGCTPVVVNFQDLSTGNPTSWLWDFGNGATSTKKDPSTTYLSPGVYTVKLTVANLTDSSTKQSTVTVADPPNVDFKSSITSGCTPAKVQFTDQSTAAPNTSNVAWMWDFGDGTQSTERSPLHVYKTADKFTVTLKVTNDRGCSRTVTKPNIINIITGVVPDFSSAVPAVCSTPVAIDFTNRSTGPGTLSYSWQFGDGGSSTVTSPKHTYANKGTYNVTLIATSNQGCTDTIKKEVIIGGYKTDFVVPVICPGKDVKFVDSSAPGPVSSLWIFPDGSSSTAKSPSFSFPAAGTFPVKLINNYGTCTDSVVKQVTVTGRPVVNFVTADSVRCQPNLISNFTNQSNGASYSWNFGDGNTSTAASPSHTYTKSGIYDVKLIATNAQGCVDSITKQSYIRIQKPVISFPTLPQRGCIPYVAKFDASIISVDKVASYKWEFGDGSTSNLPTPSHTYTKRGTYDIKLTITTSTGCTEVFSMEAGIKVGPPPAVDFTVDQNEVCAETSLKFKDLSTPKDSVNEWKWEFGDGGSSSTQNPVYQFKDTGLLDVKLTVFNNGCPSPPLTKKNFVRIKPPIARFEYAPDCNARQNYTFTDLSIGANTWEWNFGDGSPVVTGQNPGTHTFPAGFGTYNVSLKVTNGTCQFTVVRAIKIMDKTPDFSTANAEGCKLFSPQISAASPDAGSIVQYNWDFGNGAIGTGATANPLFKTIGSYNIALTTVDSFGCKDTRTRSAFVKVYGPSADFTGINSQGCRGLTASFEDKTTTDGSHPIVGWKWNFGDSSVQSFTKPPFQHTYDTVGNMDVLLEVTDSYGCIDTIRKKEFVKLSNTKAAFDVTRQSCPTSPVNFTNNTPGVFTSVWDLGDGNTSTATSFSHSYADTGTYSVKLRVRDTLGCEDSLTRLNYVQVYNPKADFDANNFVSYCLPFEAKFTNKSTYFTDRLWDLGIATSRQENPSIFYTAKGPYTITLTVTSPGGCTDVISKQLITYNQSDAALLYSPTSGCLPLKTSFEAFSPMKANFIWDFGDGNVVDTTINKIDHRYTDPGNFIPKIIFTAADDPNCKIPLVGTVPVSVYGSKPKFGINKTLFCDSGYLYISDSTTSNDRIVSYNWDYGDNVTSSNPNDTIHNYLNPGNYSVLLTVTTTNNCVDSVRSKPIKVVQSPLIHIDTDSVFCLNERIQHTGVFDRADTSAVSWLWKLPNGNTSTRQNPLLQQYGVAGTFTLSTLATNSSGCTDTDSVRILVHPLPTVSLPSVLTMQAGFPITLPAVYSSKVIGYSWLPDNNTLSCVDCPQPSTLNTKFNTNYSVAVVDSNGCKNSGNVQVNVLCQNANVFAPNTFSPNGDGSNDVFYIRGKGIERVKSLRIFNRWGETVFEKKDFQINDAASGWNGLFKGSKPHPDVYIYQVEVFCDNGDVIRLDGNVALIQ